MTAKTTKSKVALYESAQPMLGGLYREIQELAKKKPDLTLNASKVKIINRVLIDIKEIVKDESETKYLDLLDDDILPQYSDVLLVLSQYVAAMGTFKSRYYGYNNGAHQFATVD